MDIRLQPVWPIPQEMILRDTAMALENAAVVVPREAETVDLAPAYLFADVAADELGIALPVVRGGAPSGRTPISVQIADRPGAAPAPSSLPGAEGYLLQVDPAGATVLGRDLRGAFYGVSTLLQLAERRGRQVVLRGAEIRDWPYKPVRMVHLYLPGTDHLGYARRYMRDFLLRYKYNGLFVEIGGGVRLRSRPEIAVGWRRFVDELCAIGDTGPIYGEHVPLGPQRRFAASVHTHLADGRYIEPDELQRLAEWAREYALDFVPEIQGLSHSYYLASVYREIAELPEADFPDSYCPLDPRSYEILFDVMGACIELTGCRSVHIGHDEWRAGGLCPRCRERDTGELFGEDVLRIASWLRERGLGVWMWGDHLVPIHNGVGGSHDNGKVWYDHPQTLKAGRMIAGGAPDITILNWSWSFGETDSDRVLQDLGYRQIYGNFDGFRFPGWPLRSEAEGVLGAEVSSWCAWEDFELGMIHYPSAIYSANLLWSSHWPEPVEARELAARQAPKLRDHMRRSWEKPRLWSVAVLPERKRTIPLGDARNASVKAERWDLSGIRLGQQEYGGVPFEIAGPNAEGGGIGVVVERAKTTAGGYPSVSPEIPVGGAYGSLLFWQVADSEGARPMHAGDGTHYPREAAELLGWYEIRFADTLTRQAEIRYGENVLAWDHSWGNLYHAREVPAGELPDGRPLVVWGLEWTNPRPHIPIQCIIMHGAGPLPETRPEQAVSDARPILLGITAIETPKWEDFRPDKAGRLPGVD